ADIKEQQRFGIDHRFDQQDHNARRNPKIPADSSQNRFFQKDLTDTFKQRADDHEQHTDSGLAHHASRSLDCVTWSVRLMNQTPASTNKIPAIWIRSVASFK